MVSNSIPKDIISPLMICRLNKILKKCSGHRPFAYFFPLKGIVKKIITSICLVKWLSRSKEVTVINCSDCRRNNLPSTIFYKNLEGFLWGKYFFRWHHQLVFKIIILNEWLLFPLFYRSHRMHC